jgi:diaminohydroxyphosphoribosylaminopyrimidine deaminase/5-amino-6-(5-phosphoribosylamino)uracil reductase
MQEQEFFMRRCLQLATNGLGTTYPNPLVGSVIVDPQGRIIGEGWHYKSGMPHAEVNAINNALSNGFFDLDFKDCTIYVNLEPCSHTGKTPPCASLIIEKGFKKVVVGTLDPHEKVAGKGCEMLRESGIDVETGILEDECSLLNRRFFTFHKKKRPYIILKWAETSDGFIAPQSKDEKKPVFITNTYSQQRAHKLRAEEQAILVGARTVLYDDPSLTCRSWSGNSPVRIVLNSRKSLTADYQVFDDQAETLDINYKLDELDKIIGQLYNNSIQSVIVEGGAATLQAFIDAHLWDEAYQFMGADVLFYEGLKAPRLHGNYEIKSRELIEDDVLKIYHRL